jgi:PAS domain S-box-containing protein
VIPDTRTYAGWFNAPEIMATHSYVGVPIRVHNQIIGFLDLDSYQTGFFTAAHTEPLRAFADQVAMALENAQLYDHIRRHADNLEQQVLERTNELDQERARLRAILEGIAEAVIYIDRSTGRTQYVNRAFTELTGRFPEEVLTQPLLVHRDTLDSPGEFDQLSSAIEQVIGQNKVWRGNVKARRKDGIPLELELTVSSVPGPGEGLAGVVILVRDIGPERALQAQKDRFIANASHELRTPITNLKLRLYLMHHQEDKWREHLTVIEHMTAHLATLVESLLEVSRFERGVITLQRKKVVLQDVIVNAITECQIQAEAKNIQIGSKLQDVPLPVYVDPTRIRQVADNLIINAINYTSEGGQIRIDVFTEQNQEAVFRVEDNGVGISPEDMSRLFEPFYRVGKTKAQGTGLGLTIAKEIVGLHGGRIAVKSEINKGSIFSVSLPLDLRD